MQKILPLLALPSLLALACGSQEHNSKENQFRQRLSMAKWVRPGAAIAAS
jgi:hypothetical protein